MARNPLAVDLTCCAEYTGGEAAVQAIEQPSLMLLAAQDKMTPIKAGLATAQALRAEVIRFANSGHMLPIEAPREVLNALRDFHSRLG